MIFISFTVKLGKEPAASFSLKNLSLCTKHFYDVTFSVRKSVKPLLAFSGVSFSFLFDIERDRL